MPDPYFLDKLTLTGFRAYLVAKEFEFSTKRCLAVFAPNGKGKSSIVDGLEFLFSEHGTLERLGQRTVNNLAGPTALAHNLAEEEGIAPSVFAKFRKGSDRPEGTRSAVGKQATFEGALGKFEACVAAYTAAKAEEAKERSAAANAVFEKVWTAAQPLFAMDATTLETCPVCDTPIDQTAKKSTEGIREHLAQHQAELTVYAKATADLKAAGDGLAASLLKLENGLDALAGQLPSDHVPLKQQIEELKAALSVADPDSDSQIHSLALALRIAAIKLCNAASPIIVFDDNDL